MTPKVSDQHQEARRRQILEAALACFAEKGFRKTTMRDICRAAGLSTGAVYSYFENKEVLIQALSEWGRQMNQAAFSAGELQGSPKQALRSVLAAFIMRASDPNMRNAIRADAMFVAEMLTEPKLADMGCNDYETEVLGAIITIVEQLQQAGCVNNSLNSRSVAEVLFSLVQGVYWQSLLNPQLDFEAYTHAVEATVFGLLWQSDVAECDS